MANNPPQDVIPKEIKKDVSKLPKEVKSNIKDVIDFAKDYGCPKCESKNIRLVGFMESGKIAKFGCVDCQYIWEVEDVREEEDKTVYMFNALSDKVWDKVYPNLIKHEKRFYDKVKKVFEGMEEQYLSKLKKFADKNIGEEELRIVIEEEMEDDAFEGMVSGYKIAKKTAPKTLNPYAAKFIKAYSLKLAGEIALDVKENIRHQIEEGIKAGEGVKQIRQRISNVFGEGVMVNVPAKVVDGKVVRKSYTRLMSAETRARIIAQTEVMRAFNRGRFATLKDLDEVVGWRFEASADERTCSQCLDLDGKEFTKNDDGKLPPDGTHANCRCTFSYIFKKVKQEQPKPKKEKFTMYKLNDKLNFSLDKTKLKSKNRIDKGWVEFGVDNEYFLHGKKYNGKWLMVDGKLKKAEDDTPYVLSEESKVKKFVPKKGFSALPKAWRVKVPRELRWWQNDLEGKEARKHIDKIRLLLIEKKIEQKKKEEAVYGKSILEEIQLMVKNIVPLKTENRIKKFLGEYKFHKHMMSIDSIGLRQLIGWAGKKIPFKLPLKVSGTAIVEGAFRGSSGEWVYYPEETLKRAAELLTGVQLRVDHAGDGDSLDKVVGWVTKSWGKKEGGKQTIKYDGLVFDPDYAKDIYNGKIKKTSIGVYTKEEVDDERGLVAEDIKYFDELSILTQNNPACPDATIVAS